jgi:hypothetical protein
MYKSLAISKVTQIIITIMAALIIGIPVYHCLEKGYDEEEFEARKTAIRDYSKTIKSIMRKDRNLKANNQEIV